jgi:hypothetical protein
VPLREALVLVLYPAFLLGLFLGVLWGSALLWLPVLTHRLDVLNRKHGEGAVTVGVQVPLRIPFGVPDTA